MGGDSLVVDSSLDQSIVLPAESLTPEELDLKKSIEIFTEKNEMKGKLSARNFHGKVKRQMLDFAENKWEKREAWRTLQHLGFETNYQPPTQEQLDERGNISEEGLKKRVMKFFDMKNEVDTQQQIKARVIGGRLKKDLYAFGKVKFGENSAARALEHLGFNLKEQRYTPIQRIDELKKVIPKDLAEKHLNGQELVRLPDLFKTKEAKRVRTSIQNSTQYGGDSLEKTINSLYPDLREKHGINLYDALASQCSGVNRARKEGRELYFEGKQLQRDALVSEDSDKRMGNLKRLVSRVKREGGDLVEKMSWAESLSDVLDIPLEHLVPDKAELDPDEKNFVKIPNQGSKDRGIYAPMITGLIGQRMTQFALEILFKYDNNLESLPESIRKKIPTPMTKTHFENTLNKLTLENGSIADGRIDNCSRKSMVEVKTFSQSKLSLLKDKLGQYNGWNRWEDGQEITEKLAVLNSNGRTSQFIPQLESRGWNVIDGDEMYHIFEQALTVLADNDPKFFEQAPIPVYNMESLLSMYETLYERVQVLQQKGNRYFRQWMARMLTENTRSLTSGTRVDRRVLDKRYITEFSDYKEFYQKSGKNSMVNIEDVLFWDLETGGFVGEGMPNIVIGMAYYSPEHQEMVTDQLLVRTPAEEKEALEIFAEKMGSYRTHVTFNGKTFDVPFIKNRYLANLINQELNPNHIDLRQWWNKEVGKKYKVSRAALQHFERLEFGSRSQLDDHCVDIPGNQIPAAADIYWRGGDPLPMRRIAHHNKFDLITLSIMYDHYIKQQEAQNK